MTISTRDQLISAMASNYSSTIYEKASLSSLTAAGYFSLFRASGTPTSGAIPAGAAVCTNALAGAIPFTQQSAPNTSYLSWVSLVNGNSLTTLEIHDRLAHMGGLNGTLTTSQTVNLDLSSLLATSNLDARKGAADYSDVTWWMEWYTATGSTAVTATVGVTYNDGTTGTLSVALAATRGASTAIPLNNLIPGAASNKFIRAITSCTLSATTGSAGSFGFTASRLRAAIPTAAAMYATVYDWASLGLPEIYNSSCLQLYGVSNTATSGLTRMQLKIAHG